MNNRGKGQDVRVTCSPAREPSTNPHPPTRKRPDQTKSGY